jgi:hypothetical protein
MQVEPLARGAGEELAAVSSLRSIDAAAGRQVMVIMSEGRFQRELEGLRCEGRKGDTQPSTGLRSSQRRYGW